MVLPFQSKFTGGSMKKLSFILPIMAVLFLSGFFWSAINRPRSVVVDTATSTLPTAFTSAATSLKMQSLSGNYYRNIMIVNETKSPISFLTLPDVSAAPAATVTNQRMHVVSNGIAAFDNISIFDNLYLQSEDNAVNSGKIRINVW